jgi:D-alanine-D-alanine ligase
VRAVPDRNEGEEQRRTNRAASERAPEPGPERPAPPARERARLRVLLLFGGRSAEHDVSCTTAVAVARALDPDKYEVVPVGITTDGQWRLASDAQALLDKGRDALPAAFEVQGETVAPPASAGRAELVPASGDASVPVDVVLPLLHGPYGEDGTVQGMLDLAGVPYVGSGVLGSAVGMDKVMMKRAFAACGLPQAKYASLRDGGDVDAFCARVVDELGLPNFVKPANMGSSVGVSKAHDEAELRAAIAIAHDYDEWAVVEEAVVGREIEVGVLGDDPPEVSVPGEIIPAAEFYDYADKYEDGRAQLLAPAPLTDAQASDVRALAARAFEACRCEAMARVDFFLEEEGPARGFLVNELNTIPGFTPISMYPRLWEVSGLPYSALIDRLIELAMERHERRARRAGRQR